MKKLIVMAFCITTTELVFAEVDDAVIKSRIEYSERIDDGHVSDAEVRYAMRLCGYDTNRFVRVLQELAEEKPETRLTVTSHLREFGNSTALPFLYQCVTNSVDSKAGFQASWAILEIEGVTSNSIAQISKFLKLPGTDESDGGSACSSLLRYARKLGVCPELRAMAVNCAVEYASVSKDWPDLLEISLFSTDPSYRMSKRRLAALRAVTALGVSPRCTNYVATAINELVAYPEADLLE